MVKDRELLPVSFTARTLSLAECNYLTPEKEALAAVWAIDKQFLKYLLGIHFTVESNQSSLMTSQWIQHWAEKLWKYVCTPQHIPGKENSIEDFLS